MPVLGIAAPTPQPQLQPLPPTSGPQKHNGNQGPSISDVDGQRSNVSPPANSTGRIGSLLDIRI